MFRRIAALAAFALLVAAGSARAQGVDVIRGQVTGPDEAPIQNANVTATSVSGGVNRTARTDRNGRFTITFPGGEGDYFMTFAALGFQPRRFELKRVADEEILVADARLQRATAILDTVKVAADRQRVDRNADKAPDISGTEQAANAAAVAAADQGNLDALAATVPGVTAVTGADGDPAGFSVLGLSADQNSTTLNGSPFGASNLPRDASISTSVVTTPYDVSRGGFSGAQLNIRTGSGSNYIRRSTSLNFDAPPLQWTDPAARALGQQYTNLSLGGALSGPIVFDKAFYNVAWQLGRRSNDLHTLINTDPVGLEASGISIDSVAHLIQLLNTAGVPTTVDGRIPSSRLSDNGSVFGTLNLTPPSSSSGQTYSLTFNGFWNRQTPTGQLATEVPAHGGDRTSLNGGLQLNHTAYVKSVVLSETTVGVNGNRSYGSPYVDLPSASVLVNSTFADGTNGVRTLAFGGSPSLSTRSSTLGLAATNQLSWFSRSNKHRLKLTTELRQDAYDQDQTTNLLGSFYYNSLADVAANKPASFTRSLLPRTQSGSQSVAAISLGDSWKRTDNLQIQYGLRVDANHFSSSPAYNQAVQQLFGVRNDVAPNDVYASPRLGFSWTYGKAPEISAFEGAARVPRAVVRGGVGVFQSLSPASLLSAAINTTGLAGAVQQLACIGAATPVPDWDAYALDPSTIPSTCADGTTGSVFSNSAPNVTLFANDFNAPRSVRGNLQWNGPVLSNRFSLTAEVTWSRNLNQRSFVDLNFSPVAQFSLPDEGDRPVYVSESSIVPATGAIASGASRVSTQFNHVSAQRSDLTGQSRQLRLSLSPTRFSSGFFWNASYVFSDNRQQYRGFTSAAGNPFDVQWANADFSSRHQVTYTLGYNFFDAVRVSWFGRFSSGVHFTPMIAGDVNGDGYANDRAYVFNPSALGNDPVMQSAMQQLLTNGSESARNCLTSQEGHVAQRNSCTGPWTSTANMSLSLNPLKFRLPQRATLSFNVSNPLGAADLLLHGQNGLHGWGQSTTPDQTLLYVRGFDAQNQRFRYEVNPRFGSTNPRFNAFRQPVTITMALRVDVGPSRERQTLTQQLDRGRTREGVKLTEQMLKAMYGSGGVLNPMALLLRQSDTLELTGPQADSLATMNRAYTISVDSIWTGVAKDLAALPNHYDQDLAYDRYKHAREATVDRLIALAPRIRALLTPDQLRKLPPLVASYLDTRYLAGIRSGTQGNTGGGVFMPIMGGGGGRVIIRQ
ncbi:MAG TPA: carboxypeptidase regulatory-like domain-containing protein [Gemmatimonadaceae bacterium]|nr:carboxypeptidase regulatory-like domain-containing protein [Gemmatimonadaceae bacterium]